MITLIELQPSIIRAVKFPFKKSFMEGSSECAKTSAL